MKFLLGGLYIGFGFFIDFFQFMLAQAFVALGAGLQAITPVGGGLAGTGAGCAVGWSLATDILTGITGCIQGGIIGAAGGVVASIFGTGIGIALAYIISVCITLSFGTMLVTLLWFSGMRYPGSTLGVYIAEIFPLVNIAPGWGIYAARCVYKHYTKESVRQVTNKIAPHNNTFPPKEYGAAA